MEPVSKDAQASFNECLPRFKGIHTRPRGIDSLIVLQDPSFHIIIVVHSLCPPIYNARPIRHSEPSDANDFSLPLLKSLEDEPGNGLKVVWTQDSVRQVRKEPRLNHKSFRGLRQDRRDKRQ